MLRSGGSNAVVFERRLVLPLSGGAANRASRAVERQRSTAINSPLLRTRRWPLKAKVVVALPKAVLDVSWS